MQTLPTQSLEDLWRTGSHAGDRGCIRRCSVHREVECRADNGTLQICTPTGFRERANRDMNWFLPSRATGSESHHLFCNGPRHQCLPVGSRVLAPTQFILPQCPVLSLLLQILCLVFQLYFWFQHFFSFYSLSLWSLLSSSINCVHGLLLLPAHCYSVCTVTQESLPQSCDWDTGPSPLQPLSNLPGPTTCLSFAAMPCPFQYFLVWFSNVPMAQENITC